MQDQSQILIHTELVQQGLDVFDSPSECVVVMLVIRFVRQPAADVIRNDHTISIAQPKDEVSIVERPGGVAMQTQHRLALAFIHVMEPERIDSTPMRCKLGNSLCQWRNHCASTKAAR